MMIYVMIYEVIYVMICVMICVLPALLAVIQEARPGTQSRGKSFSDKLWI
jgi:hypothetical protein